MKEQYPRSEPALATSLVEQRGWVVSVSPGLVWVVTSRKGACGGCSSSSACATPILGSLAGNGASGARIQVEDHLGLRVGEGVVLGIPDGTLIRASALAYLLPPALLVLAASGAGALGFSDLGSALVGLIGLAMGLALTWLLTGGAAERVSYRPVLVRRHQALPSVALKFQQF